MRLRRGMVTERRFGTDQRCITGDVAIEFPVRADHVVNAKVKPESGQALIQIGSIKISGSAEDLSDVAAAFSWAMSQLEVPIECAECGDLHAPRGCVTAELAEKRWLQRRVYHDSLTGLPNRDYLASIGAEMQVQVGPSGYLGALLIDLDGFKPVNDTYGHPVGDTILQEVGRRLAFIAGQVGEQKAAAARLGGDEFAVLVSSLDGDPNIARGEMTAFGHTVHDALAMPYPGIAMRVSATVGVAVASTTTELSVLLKHADRALIGAKQDGAPLWVSPILGAQRSPMMGG